MPDLMKRFLLLCTLVALALSTSSCSILRLPGQVVRGVGNMLP